MKKLIANVACIAGLLSAFASPVRGDLGAENEKFAADMELTAASYIQDGLIAMWDAVENVDWGVHDPDTRTWYALVGGGVLNLPTAASFTDNALLFDRTLTSGRFKITSQLDAQFWTDYMAALDAKTVTYENCYTLTEYGESAGTGLNYVVRSVVDVIDDPYGFLCPRTQVHVYFNTNGGGWGYYWITSKIGTAEGLHTLAGLFNPNGARVYASLYFDGIHKTSSVVPTSAVADENVDFSALYAGKFSIGSRYQNATVDKIHNFRIYNRVLSSDEIQYNALVDRIRFGL